MKTNHLTLNELTGYIYSTLDDAQREAMNAHLLDCPICRTNLANQEARQRHISNDLKAALNFASPSMQMNYAAIAPRLQNARPGWNTWLDRTVFVPTALVLTGFIFAVLGLWHAISQQAFITSQPLGAFPTLSCFFLALA